MIFAVALSLEEAIKKLIQGLGLVGNGISSLVRYLFFQLGLDVPEAAISIATILVLVLALYKGAGTLNKIVLIALVFLLLSSSAGLLTQLLGLGSLF